MKDSLFDALARPPLKIVKKDWGREIWFANDEKNNYCGKLLYINKGAGFKMHMHYDKVETFFLMSGELKVTLIDTKDRSRHEGILEEGDCLDLDRMVPHAVEALEESIIIEASTFHRDEDSYRI